MLLQLGVRFSRISFYQVRFFKYARLSFQWFLSQLLYEGVGHVTIVDEQKVTKQDIHNNFFLDPDSTGQSKAKSAAELLQELNEDASVVHIEKVSQITGKKKVSIVH